MNLLIDIPAGTADEMNVIIEIPEGSRNKYEYDKDLNIFLIIFFNIMNFLTTL